jgi:hypothetical protein
VDWLIILQGKLDLEIKDLLVLFLGLRRQLLIVVEEARGGREDL